MTKASLTRLTILEKAFEIIYTKGYQTTSIDEIIATTKVTKGAFYYHFKTKDEMGLAIINEILMPTIIEGIKSFDNIKDPKKEIFNMIENMLFNIPFLKVEFGCPIGNLTQEMAPWNNRFSIALSELISFWQLAIEKCITKGKENGTIRKNVNTQQVAYFVMSGYWGIRSFGKVYNNTDCYKSYLKELKIYLNNLS